MAAYLAGAAGTAALLGAPQAEAAVTAVTFGFGPTLTSTDGQGNSNLGANGMLGHLGAAQPIIALGGQGTVGIRLGEVYHTGSYLTATHGRASFFADGTVIGGGGNGALEFGYFHHYSISSLQFNADQLNKNIGFKTSTGNFGWANVSWTEATKTLTVNSAFVETVANTPITITAVPEPSRALLALAGLGGVALRRRRKQAA